MHFVFLTIAVMFMICGVILRFVSYRDKSPEAPNFWSWSPRLWISPIWRHREWFSRAGYRKFVVGSSLITVGALLYLGTMHFR